MTHDGTACVSQCLLPCYSLDISFRLTTQCRTVFSAHMRRPSVSSHCGAYLSEVGGLPSQHSLNWFQPNSIPHTRVWLSTCFKSTFFAACGRTTLISTSTCPSKNKVCHRGHLMPRTRVPRMMAPTGPLTCLQVRTSKTCFLHAFCCALLYLPIHTPPAQKNVAMVDVLGLSSSHSRHSSTKQ